jgi:putative glutamine amidotransferase
VPFDDAEPLKHRVFLTMGGKVAHIIGAGGVATVNSGHEYGLREPQKAPGLFATAYSVHDGVIEALEQPGRHWVIGLQWRAHVPDELPARFDNLLAALVERSGDTVGDGWTA